MVIFQGYEVKYTVWFDPLKSPKKEAHLQLAWDEEDAAFYLWNCRKKKKSSKSNISFHPVRNKYNFWIKTKIMPKIDQSLTTHVGVVNDRFAPRAPAVVLVGADAKLVGRVGLQVVNDCVTGGASLVDPLPVSLPVADGVVPAHNQHHKRQCTLLWTHQRCSRSAWGSTGLHSWPLYLWDLSLNQNWFIVIFGYILGICMA